MILVGCASDQAVEVRSGPTTTWDFEQDKVGKAPKPWSITETNPTTSRATWQVITDRSSRPGTNVLALTDSDNYDGTYNLAIAKKTSFRDLDLTVRAKAVSGTEDQGGGPIWRCRDRNNYYICRFNPLEGNFRVYVVIDGRRQQLASDRVELTAGRWYKIRVRMEGGDITCWLDGEELLYASDNTFERAGKVGLWTKADAVTSFDDLTVRVVTGDDR
ncbi:MAG: family 16 glycoside hydrolase [Planctomycetota bacterium]|jgi:hypothetical protein